MKDISFDDLIPERDIQERRKQAMDISFDDLMPATQEQVKAPSQLMSELARTGRAVAGGVSGLADLGYMAVAPIYQGMRAGLTAAGVDVGAPQDVQRYAPSTALKAAYDAATGGAGVPQTNMQKAVQAGGELLAGGTAAGLAAKAPQIVASGQELAKFMSPQTMAQAGSFAGAGIGGETASQAFPDSAIAPAVGSLVGGAIPSMVSTIPGAIIPKASKETGKLALRARELDIPLRADQIAPTRVRKTFQKIGQELPGSGADAFENIQRKSFNHAVARTIGQESDILDPGVINRFQEGASRKFGDILSGRSMKVGRGEIESIANIKKEARGLLSSDLLGIVDNNVDSVLRDIRAGTVSGEKMASIRSSMLSRATRAQGGARQFIGDIIDKLDEITAKNLPPDKIKELSVARREWRNYKTIEPLLEGSTDGNIDPTKLMSRVKASKYIKASRSEVGSDDLVDLARIGKEFLPKTGGSDTFQKTVLGGGVGTLGTAAFMNPAMALQGAAIAGTTLAANRGIQALGRNQVLVDAALKRSVTIPKEIYSMPPKLALETLRQLQEQ